MNPKELHNRAMDLSFQARQAIAMGDHTSAFDQFSKAAEIESEVAKFYFDKPDLEPTRSILIRSAAFLNLKAGQIENAKEFIFFGLLNTNDELIKSQLNDALEIAVSLSNLSPDSASEKYSYISLLRQRSIHYSIEPSNGDFGSAVSLEMIRGFSSNFLSSFKAYAGLMFDRAMEKVDSTLDSQKEFLKLANPLVTASSFGSFKFSIASDFIKRFGEETEIVNLRANIVSKYHDNIFTNSLDDENISMIKENFSSDEIDAIFRPLTRIKSRNSPYRIAYYGNDSFTKTYIPKIATAQKKKLLPIKNVSEEEIGKLESSLSHARQTESGKVSKKVIFKEELKSYEFDHPIKEIYAQDKSSIILNEEILINVSFDSETGFTLSFQDLNLESHNTEFQKSLDELNRKIFYKISYLANKKERNDLEEEDWLYVKSIINNPDALANQK